MFYLIIDPNQFTYSVKLKTGLTEGDIKSVRKRKTMIVKIEIGCRGVIVKVLRVAEDRPHWQKQG